jgi:pyruvate formate lyase activating enzyme
MNYGEVTSAGMDPIEKKPLYHFHPASNILSLGTFGCNLSCGFCQNWQISQQRPPTQVILPEEAVRLAQKHVPDGNIGLAYTYNEPFIWYEYIRETAPLIKEAGLYNVLVTNGIVEAEPLEELLPFIDAMNVDIKSMSEKFYLQHCKGQALPARQTVERAFGCCHVEITTLVIPGLNDSPEEIGRLAQWLSSVNPDIVLHLSRFFPNYKMKDVPPTPLPTLQKARDSALHYLRHVYLGNV